VTKATKVLVDAAENKCFSVDLSLNFTLDSTSRAKGRCSSCEGKREMDAF